MAQLAQATDYTDKDFDALRARLIALIKSVFPDWTDFGVASFGNLLVELYTYVGNVLTFYQDRRATRRTTTMATTTHLGGEHSYLHPDANIDASDCLDERRHTGAHRRRDHRRPYRHGDADGVSTAMNTPLTIQAYR